jgi:hypothetical protein
MGLPSSTPVCGDYRGAIAPAFEEADLLAWLARLREHAAADATPGQGGTRLRALDAPWRGGVLPLVVKSHPPAEGRLKPWADRRWGTAAQRAWRAALKLQSRGVGTPEPVAWLERWDHERCVESHFITRRIEGVSSLRDELRHLFRQDPDAGRVIALLEVVAPAIRAMHSAGVFHGDLGNQNILLRRVRAGEWRDVSFVDLNRARLFPNGPVPLKWRARDLSRLWLPTDLLRVFVEIYFSEPPPDGFKRALAFHRARYAFHDWSRRYRHPIREARLRADPARAPDYPPPRDIWLWDEKSAQPINAWASSARNRLHPPVNYWTSAREVVRGARALRREYCALREDAYARRVAMDGRWGMSVEPRPGLWETERAWLPAVAGLPVLIRLYRHKGARQWDLAVQAGRELADAGFRVSFALCQDRRAVIEPSAWAAMCERAVPQVASFADEIEIGHAINRVKWGVWDLRDYRRLVEPLADLKQSYPNLKCMGPAGIDFEYPSVLSALSALPEGFRFDALSHHLYVDRRGAPENRQGRFAALEKFALARAVARVSGRCADRLIVSEVNWPLLDTGVYSPVCSPYMYPGQYVGAPNVSEEDYARFMVRYLLQAACSGLVDRVFWWRLAAHGFGVVDDRADPWRPRPAWRAWTRLLEVVGGATFIGNLPLPGGAVLHQFERPDGERLAIGYAWTKDAPGFAIACGHAEAMNGERLDAVPRALGPDPVYFRQLA